MGNDDAAGAIGRSPGLADEVLAARAAAGDPHAFERLVRRHQRHMFAVALRITRRRADAEDATQNAFSAAWRKLPDYDGDAAFGTWMYRITTNHALNQVRSRKRSDRQADLDTLPETDQPSSKAPGPESHGEASALLDDLHAALDTLPEELRVCWLAREVDGCSYAEVAALTGASVDVVRGRIHRARQRIAARMQDWR